MKPRSACYFQRYAAMISVTLVGALLLVSQGVAAAPQSEDSSARQAKAKSIFQERCKKAGEFVYRTVENVDSVLLLKIRNSYNHSDQFRMDDPYGHDSWGDEYIKSFFLEPTLHANRYASAEMKEKIRRDYAGYRYVDAINPKDGSRYRYTGGVKAVGKMDITAYNVQVELKRDPNYDLNIYAFVLDKIPAPDPVPRYGVTYEDISTQEERNYWVAGSSLKVIDLKTNEVMAERVGYMWDPGQGNNSGGRAPWLAAAEYACPSFRPANAQQPGFSYQSYQTRRFVTKVLQPVAGK